MCEENEYLRTLNDVLLNIAVDHTVKEKEWRDRFLKESSKNIIKNASGRFIKA